MIDERREELASLYATGALSPGDASAFESELARDAELQKLVASLRDAAAALAGTAPLIQPPPGLRAQILARVGAAEKIVPLPANDAAERQSYAWLPWALAACLAFFCGVLAVRDNSLSARVDQLDRMATVLQNTTNDLQQTIAQLRETNQLASMRIALLGSLLSDQPKAVAVSLWDEKNQNGVFVVENLKALPDDKDYQLWVIDPQYGTPVDAGVFKVDADGKVRFQFKAKQAIKTANKFAVTEEQKGGSPTPKGQVVMAGG
jgi:anti-sigma-K factor RskA